MLYLGFIDLNRTAVVHGGRHPRLAVSYCIFATSAIEETDTQEFTVVQRSYINSYQVFKLKIVPSGTKRFTPESSLKQAADHYSTLVQNEIISFKNYQTAKTYKRDNDNPFRMHSMTN